MTKLSKIRDVNFVRKEVDLSTGHLVEVRGLNVSDIMLLTTMFGPQIAMAYSQFKDQTAKGPITNDDLMKVLLAVIHDAPKLIGWIIAMANDDANEEASLMASSLPAVDQVTLLHEVINETFSNEATVKKLGESLSAIFLTISGALKTSQKTQKSSRNGTGVSVVQ